MLHESPLGKETTYVETYSPDLLFPVPRQLGRDKTGIKGKLPFKGIDLWNAYELSWLNSKGKPEVAMATIIVSCAAPNIIESKSLKLYLNSLNQTKFDSFEVVKQTLEKDLSHVAGDRVQVEIFSPCKEDKKALGVLPGVCLDDLDVQTSTYEIDPKFLTILPEKTEETVNSHLLKSNCLATGQPDWGSVVIRYSGPKIDHKGLLKYLISYRRHSGFHEHCVEHIFHDILNTCHPEKLTVYARYTRRGGLDINPFRSNFEQPPANIRLSRQ
jgi:7-cyano-7-deazaguanine reductase